MDGGPTFFDTWKNFSLTLKGGWDGNSGSTVTNPLTPSTLSQGLEILGWSANVTLSDITFDSPTGAGLTITTSKDIALTRVKSNTNVGDGADLDNTINSGTGKVIINDSEFNTNGGTFGLLVTSNGTITLNNVIASGNTAGGGASLQNVLAPLPKAVTLTGTNEFSNNSGSGLQVDTKGVITANNLTASENGSSGTDSGAILSNANSGATAGVTLTGANVFNDNFFNGLDVQSYGAIKTSNLTASGNLGGDGASLVNDTAASAMNVTLTGLNTFNNNAVNGLNVSSIGVISATQLIADYNTLDGVCLNNCFNYTCTGYAAKAISISGFGEFTDNGNHGLAIDATGAVTLNNMTATDNGGVGLWDGVNIENVWLGTGAASVTLNGGNNFNSNTNNGLYVVSLGAITVNNASANGNDWGFDLRNQDAFTPQNVKIAGYLNAISNANIGLWIRTDGTVSAVNLTTNDNGQEGTFIDNVGAPSLKAVSITGTNVFNNNDEEGLQIVSSGAITLNNLTALGNGYNGDFSGVYIHNGAATTIQQNVTLNGTNVFNHNSHHGLELYSYGVVTLNNVTANDNGSGIVNLPVKPCDLGCGAYIINSGGSSAKAVLIKGVNSFNQNAADGLRAYSDGAITLYNLTASNNGRMGAYLYNSNSSVQSKVLLNGYGLFEKNGWDGLHIFSSGAVTTNNLTANSNTGDGVTNGNGVYIYIKGLSAPQAVMLNGNNIFTSNGTAGIGSGLVVWSDGTIKVNNINASFNQFKGAQAG